MFREWVELDDLELCVLFQEWWYVRFLGPKLNTYLLQLAFFWLPASRHQKHYAIDKPVTSNIVNGITVASAKTVWKQVMFLQNKFGTYKYKYKYK